MEGENKYEQQSSDSNSQGEGEVEVKPKPNQKCPRCDSLNTKFCYFNNCKITQPRYFCNNCRRYWTHGGNVRITDNERMKGARDPFTSGGCASNSLPSQTITSAGGNVRRVGTLNLTRPRLVANQPALKFVHVDINSLSFTQGFSGVLNPYVAPLQDRALPQGFNRVLNTHITFPLAQGKRHSVQSNGQYHQASSGHLGMDRWDPSYLNTNRASHYMEPVNGNIFWNSNNQIGHHHGDLSCSSSGAWSAPWIWR